MAVDEDLLIIAPIAVALVFFLVTFFSILVDFQANRSQVELLDVGYSIGQAISLNASGVIREADLPGGLAVKSRNYVVSVNLTELETGQSWQQGYSNGSAVVSLPVLLEKRNGYQVPAKLFVRVGLK